MSEKVEVASWLVVCPDCECKATTASRAMAQEIAKGHKAITGHRVFLGGEFTRDGKRCGAGKLV